MRNIFRCQSNFHLILFCYY